VVWLFALYNTDWMVRHEALSLLAGAVLVPTFAWMWNWPQRLTFDGDRLVRTPLLRPSQVLRVREISAVEGYYRFHVGPKVSIRGADHLQEVELNPGPNDQKLLLRRLGRRLEQLEMTTVIKDEKTRRVVGIPGGGLRDPWAPRQEISDCPECGHDWREHPGSPIDAAAKGRCGECVVELQSRPRRLRGSACGLVTDA
jgi:hypothetical protein